MTSCGLATPIGNIEDCEVSTGWSINHQLNLDSGQRGIPQGLKFSMKAFLTVTNQYGAWAVITYRMKDFSDNEVFRVLVNGKLQMRANSDSISMAPSAKLASRE